MFKDSCKIVAMDLDRTLLRKDKSITEDFAKFIEKLKNKGIIPLIATGREFNSARACINYLDIDIICNNGNIIRLAGNGDIEYKNSIVRTDFLNLISHELSKKLASIVHVDGSADDIDIVFLESGKLKFKNYIANFNKRILCVNSYEDVNYDILSVIFSGEREDLEFTKRVFASRFKNFTYHIMSFDRSDSHIMEILNERGDKYFGVKQFAKNRGIDMSEVLAIGDDVNDLLLLKNAGLGIAMKNGVDELKSQADIISDFTNDEDGCLKIIEKVLDI